MSAAPRARPLRPQRVTILLVGEGYAEVALLSHLKSLCAPRNSGVAVTIKNARGKGAAQVVEYAIGQTRNASYDRRLALLDTDTDWTPAVGKRARQARIDVVGCEPCLEALLLRVHAAPVRDGLTSRQLKQQFEERFGCAADEPRLYVEHFGRERLERARQQLRALDRLLCAFDVQGPSRLK